MLTYLLRPRAKLQDQNAQGPCRKGTAGDDNKGEPDIIDPMGEVDVVSGFDAASSVSGLAFGGGSAV